MLILYDRYNILMIFNIVFVFVFKQKTAYEMGIRDWSSVVCTADLNGQCVFNPHGDGVVPKAAVTRTYPVLEKFGLVWVWMGQKAADPAKLPNFDFMDDTRWTYVKGHIHGSGYYELFTDNILDL